MLTSILAIFASSGAVSAAAVNRRASASSFCSSSDGNYKFSDFDAPGLGASNDQGLDTWDFTIKENSGHKQTINGFGACVTDGTVASFNALSDEKRNELLKDIMTSEGLNFNLMRHTVASSDLSADPAYTYDDNGGQVDTDISSFGLGDRGNAMISMLSDMKGLQSDMTLLGSPWSPPGWMKQNSQLIGTTDKNNLNHDYADAYGQYFVKYLQAYEEAGVHVDAITIQNEPLNSKAQMPTMYIYADESGQLVQNNVGPALKAANLDTKVWAYDHNTDRYDYPESVVQTAPDYVPATAWHCYAGNDVEHWQPLTKFHDQFPNQEQYMTECYTADGITDWKHSSNFNILPLDNWANGIIAWALGTYNGGDPALSGTEPCHSCTGLVTVDPDAGTYTKTIDYYMMGQFSRYIPKGAVVVEETGSYLYDDGTGLYSIATTNPDGSRTVVIQNLYDHDMFVRVGTESDGQTWNARVYASSVTTWQLP